MTKMFHLVLASVLLAGCSAAQPPNGRTRDGLTIMYKLVLAGHDTDGDGKWSRSEVDAMMDTSLSADPQQAPNRDQMRARLSRDFAAQDLNRDGYLDLVELLKEHLTTFTCVDANSDASLSQSEIERRMRRCDSDQDYVPL
jgi:hypothetical protein